jgi:hypothetical protein
MIHIEKDIERRGVEGGISMNRWLNSLTCGLLLVWSDPQKAQAWYFEFDDANSTSSGLMTAEVSAGSDTDSDSYGWQCLDTSEPTRQVAVDGPVPSCAITTLHLDAGFWAFGDWAQLFYSGVNVLGNARHRRDPICFRSTINGTWKLYWKVSPPGDAHLRISFALPYEIYYLSPEIPEECWNASSEVTYKVELSIGGKAFGPYELKRSSWPPELGGNWPDPLAITSVCARAGDIVELSLNTNAVAKTLECDMDSDYVGPSVNMALWMKAELDVDCPEDCPPNCPPPAPCQNGRWHPISFPSCDCPSACPPGKLGETIVADSGERMDVWWVNTPFPHYELRYYPTGDPAGFPISEAVFGEGCNYAEYLAPDDNGNGKPDYFCVTAWHCWDFGYDHGTPGFLDHVLERYDVQKSTFSATLFVHQYSPGCAAPVGATRCWCDLKQLKKECLPTSDRIVSVTPFLPSMTLGSNIRPSLADLLWILSLQMNLNPGQTTVMGHLPVRLCDMDWDGDCDLTDFQIATKALGTSWQDPNYYAVADADGDGHVTEADLNSLFNSADTGAPPKVGSADLLVLAERWLGSVP